MTRRGCGGDIAPQGVLYPLVQRPERFALLASNPRTLALAKKLLEAPKSAQDLKVGDVGQALWRNDPSIRGRSSPDDDLYMSAETQPEVPRLAQSGNSTCQGQARKAVGISSPSAHLAVQPLLTKPCPGNGWLRPRHRPPWAPQPQAGDRSVARRRGQTQVLR